MGTTFFLYTKIYFCFLITSAIAKTIDQNEVNDDNPGYKFAYGVYDPLSHDIKQHHEERHGKYVTGFYTFREADGSTRLVRYKVGPTSGFEAVVERIETGQPPSYERGIDKYGVGSGRIV